MYCIHMYFLSIIISVYIYIWICIYIFTFVSPTSISWFLSQPFLLILWWAPRWRSYHLCRPFWRCLSLVGCTRPWTRTLVQSFCNCVLAEVLKKGMERNMFFKLVYLTTFSCTHWLVLMITPVFVLLWLIACLVIFVLYIVLFEVMYSMVSGVIATDWWTSLSHFQFFFLVMATESWVKPTITLCGTGVVTIVTIISMSCAHGLWLQHFTWILLLMRPRHDS